MLSKSILIYAKNTDDNSTEIYVRQIIEKYNIDDIRTLYMARNVKGYTEQITIKEKEEISDFLKELYNLKLTTNKDEGNIKIDLWRDTALGTVTIYSSTKGLSNQDISYYIDLQDVDKIIENMNLHWVENKASGPGYPVAGVAPKENSKTVSDIMPEMYVESIKFRAETPGEYGHVNISNLSVDDTKKIYNAIRQLKLYDNAEGKSLYFSFYEDDTVYAYDSRYGFTLKTGDKSIKVEKYISYTEFMDVLETNGLNEWVSPGGVPEVIKGPTIGLCVKDVLPKTENDEYFLDDISAIYLFRQGNENPEYAVLNNENRNEFLDKLAALVLYDSNDGTYGKIEFEINNSLPRKTFYVSNAGFTQTDGNKILKYLNWNDVENILQYMNIEWKNLSGVDLNGTTPGIGLPNKSDKEELSKTYEIGILNQNGIIVGDPDGDLREGDEITRAEFAAVLCRAMGCEDETENDDLKQKNYFPDVPVEHWAAGYVNFAYENGAISGFPDGNFYPEQKVTNEQVIKMLIGAWGYSDEAEKNGGYPNGYMKVAKEHGVLDTIEFNYKNASKRWVASVFVYGVLSMPTENPKVKQPIKTELISVEQPREENDNYVEHPEEILRNVSKESSFYERTTFEQRVPTKHLPIKIDGKNITNVWFRDFSIGINIVGAKQEGFHAELAVGESVDVSDFANGEYNIIVGYNDGKVDDYSFGKIAISDENVELAGFMHRYTNLRDVIQFDQTVTEVELSNENTMEDMPFELKATSDGKGGYVLCINYSGSLTGEQEFSYAINDIDESLNYKVDESERFTAPMTSIEPIVIHNLQSGTEYCLQARFNDKHIQKSIMGTLTVANDDFLFKGNWQITTMK